MNIYLKVITSLVLVHATSAFASDMSCDLDKGKRVFNKCAACHSLDADKHMMGPSLHQLLGRKAGSQQDFRYSRAFKHSEINWERDTLDQFLKSPMKYVPGTTMPFGGLRNDADRQALVCYLLNQK